MTSDGEFPDSDLDVEGEDAPWVDDLPDDDVDSAQDVLVAAARAAAIAEFGEIDELNADAEADEDLLPVVAVVGRPNVGKSTLVNRILGRREAVVEDVPGVTRDRVTYESDWNGRRFLLMDTGGWQRDARGMAGQIAAQAQRA